MMFRFGEVESALAEIHEIAPTERPAFRARMRNLKRAGLDFGASGPGRKANLTIANAVQLAFAVELGKQGNSPERCARMVERNDKKLRSAVHKSLESLDVIMVIYFPDAWAELSNRTYDHDTISSTSVNDLVSNDGQLVRAVMGVASNSVAFINMSAIVHGLLGELTAVDGLRTILRGELLDWAATATEEA